MKKKGASQVLWIVITLVMALVVLGVFTTIPTRMWEGIKIMGGLQTSGSISLCAAGNGVNSFFNTAVPDDIDNDGVPDNCDNCICKSPDGITCDLNDCNNKLSDKDKDGYPKACDNDRDRGEDKFGKWDSVCYVQIKEQITKGTREFCKVDLTKDCTVIASTPTETIQPNTGTNPTDANYKPTYTEPNSLIKPVEPIPNIDVQKMADISKVYERVLGNFKLLQDQRNQFDKSPNKESLNAILAAIRRIRDDALWLNQKEVDIERKDNLKVILGYSRITAEDYLNCMIFFNPKKLPNIEDQKVCVDLSFKYDYENNKFNNCRYNSYYDFWFPEGGLDCYEIGTQ